MYYSYEDLTTVQLTSKFTHICTVHQCVLDFIQRISQSSHAAYEFSQPCICVFYRDYYVYFKEKYNASYQNENAYTKYRNHGIQKGVQHPFITIHCRYHIILVKCIAENQTQEEHQTDRTYIKNLSHVVTQSTCVVTQSASDKVLK